MLETLERTEACQTMHAMVTAATNYFKPDATFISHHHEIGSQLRRKRIWLSGMRDLSGSW